MNIRKSWLFFFMMLLLSACVFLLAAEQPLRENRNVLQGVSEAYEWQSIGVGIGRTAAAAGWRDGAVVLRYFTTDGTLLSEQTVQLPETAANGTITRLLPVREGLSYLGLYGPNGNELYLFRLCDNAEPEKLLTLTCSGASFAERTAHTYLSELNYEDGEMSFAVCTDGRTKSYACSDSGGLEAKGTGNAENALSVLSFKDGKILYGGKGFLSMNDKRAGKIDEGQAVTCLTQGRSGWYYIDASELTLCFTEAAFNTSYRLFNLDTKWCGAVRNMTSIALTRDESVLMLLDGTWLMLAQAEGMQELTGILRPTGLQAGWGLAKYGLFALLAAAVLWFLLCGMRRGYAPLVVFRGAELITLSLLCITVIHFGWFEPAQKSAALQQNETILSYALRSANAESRLRTESIAKDVGRMLDGQETDGTRNVRVIRAEQMNGAWKTTDGRLAVTLNGFDSELADLALVQGKLVCRLRGNVLQAALAYSDSCLSICMENPQGADIVQFYNMMLIGFAISVGLSILILLLISRNVRRISRKMESISQGSVPERLNLHSGDELETMASIVNSLSVSMHSQNEERKLIEFSYRRFVPEKVLALLGKKNIQEVDKSTYAARRMAVMTVSFTFRESLYTDIGNSRLLFDSVNEVIERTASIVGRKNGTVFHYAYNGYDVVMDDGSEAISTAVAIQQEVLSFNEQRQQSGLPCAALRIALDKGDVMLGIVGDNSQMEPTTISTSLSTVQELIRLCDRLNAGILCTEAIISERQDYGNRYMGKCAVGNRPVRVYEVFDGDEYGVRRGKAGTMQEFSEGVYDLYAGDAAAAKHIFLKLAHDNPQDGGAIYYLYLADRLEHDPTQQCLLNSDGMKRS